MKLDLRKKENPRRTLVGFKTDSKTYEKLKKQAEEKGMTLSFYVHQLLINSIS